MVEKIVFKSKIGLETTIFLIVVFGGISIMFGIDGYWLGLLPVLFLAALVAWAFTSIKYTIENNELKVRCGFLVNETIPISTIKTIAETSSVLSAPAASFNRLEIFYNTYDSIMISPKSKSDFIKILQGINNNITVKLKGAIVPPP